MPKISGYGPMVVTKNGAGSSCLKILSPSGAMWVTAQESIRRPSITFEMCGSFNAWRVSQFSLSKSLSTNAKLVAPVFTGRMSELKHCNISRYIKLLSVSHPKNFLSHRHRTMKQPEITNKNKGRRGP